MACGCDGAQGKPGSPEELGRRAFLTRAAALLGGLVAATLGGVGLGYFVSPAYRKKAGAWVELGGAGDFKPGMPVLVEYTQRKRDAWVTSVNRSSAWVVTSDGKKFTAYDPRCTHLGCPFRWSREENKFLCPCHTASFNIEGKVLGGPAPRSLDRYQTKVEGGRLSILPEAAS